MPFSRDELPGERAVAGAPTVAHLVPEYLPLVRGVLEARPDTGPLVSHTVWETDRVPAHWPALLNDVDLIVVPSEWNRQVFAEGGVTTPSVAVPHVACDPVPGSDDAVAALDLPDDVIVFYSIGRWDERKAMFHTVRAFLEAFTADDPVVLVVKTGVRIEMPPAEGWGADTRFAYTTGWQVAQLVRHYARPAAVRVRAGDVDRRSGGGVAHARRLLRRPRARRRLGDRRLRRVRLRQPGDRHRMGRVSRVPHARARVARRPRAGARAPPRVRVVLSGSALGRAVDSNMRLIRSRGRPRPPRRAHPGRPAPDSSAHGVQPRRGGVSIR